jgi:tetraacyldisaccharide 4'-kinase
MRAPSFWWRDGSLAATLLAPVANVYGAVAARRMAQPGERVGIPVLCVGDPTLGGSGKTPAALTIARLLRESGRHPFFLTRGYGGRLAGPAVVDVVHHDAADVGDEPLLLARDAPTIVARDRVAGARAARRRGADVIVMDDGFQNPSLAKDCSLLVVDGRRGIGNGRVFPAGPLRAPLGAQLGRAQALLVLGTDDQARKVTLAAEARGRPIFHGQLIPDPAAMRALAGTPVLAFAGIGNPEKFFATLTAGGVHVKESRSFPDHHRYTAAEAQALLAAADRQHLQPVTTEKDFVRLSGAPELRRLAERTRTLPVTLAVQEEAAFRAFLAQALALAG